MRHLTLFRKSYNMAMLCVQAMPAMQLIVPELAQYLATPGLQTATEQALWAIFHRSPNPSVSELMNQVRYRARI